MMEQVELKASHNGKIIRADVLKRSRNTLRVVPVGTDYPFTLVKHPGRRVYMGDVYGIELTTDGKELPT